jgi:hypothetical protein
VSPRHRRHLARTHNEGAVGTTARRGIEPSGSLGIGFIQLIPSDEWWIAEFYTNHPRVTVYVNIGTPPLWDGDRVHQVDLDVIRKLDGTVAVLDECELVVHQVRYRYPPDLIASALAAGETAVDRVRNREGPLGGAADGWIAKVDRVTLR